LSLTVGGLLDFFCSACIVAFHFLLDQKVEQKVKPCMKTCLKFPCPAHEKKLGIPGCRYLFYVCWPQTIFSFFAWLPGNLQGGFHKGRGVS